MLTMEKNVASKPAREKPRPEEKTPTEELIRVKKMLQKLKDKDLILENPTEYKELSYQAYKDLSSFFINEGAEFVTDVNEIYQEFGNKQTSPIIIRREDPKKVAALSEGFPINLNFDPKVVGERGDKYANCAIWPYGRDAVSGIRNSFLKGRGMAGPLVTLIGVSHNPKSTELTIPEEFMIKVGTIERDAVRIASGNLTKEDLQFIILRIQKDFFPEENLSDSEKTENNKQIFRGFIF